jgi:thioredoxin-dependent peroxiredoxin
VIAVSVDGQPKNSAFARALGLTFPVLSDTQRTAARDYGVLIPVLRLAKRVTFIIDKQGIIQGVKRGGEAMNPGNALASCTALK